jgi:hypothetical protein
MQLLQYIFFNIVSMPMKLPDIESAYHGISFTHLPNVFLKDLASQKKNGDGTTIAARKFKKKITCVSQSFYRMRPLEQRRSVCQQLCPLLQTVHMVYW